MTSDLSLCPYAVNPATGNVMTVYFSLDSGWQYATETEDTKDNRKLWHFLVCDNSDPLEIDWSPYDRMEREDCELWLLLGRPGRQGPSPLTARDLKHMAVCKLRRISEQLKEVA